MNRKQVTIIVGILVALCCCVAGLGLAGMWYAGDQLGGMMEGANDPENVTKIAQSIATYDLPAGYEQIGFDILSIKYIFMMPGDNQAPMIMLAQFPDSMVGNQEELAREMESSMARQTGQGAADLQVVEQKTYTIRGQQVETVIMDGVADIEGQSVDIRQMIIVFDGKEGMAALMFYGAKAGWDQTLVDSFIASVR